MKTVLLAVLLLTAAGPALASQNTGAPYLPPESACAAEIKAIIYAGLTRGPYIVETETQIGPHLMLDETRAIPGKAVHERNGDASGILRESIVVGDKGWTFFRGEWSEMPAEMARHLLDSASGGYVSASVEHIKDARCHGDAEFDANPAKAYSYSADSDGWDIEASMFADPVTKLPLATVQIVRNATTEATISSIYNYDPELVIEPPADN